MTKHKSKKYKKVVEKIDKSRVYNLDQALELVKELSYTRFPGTVEFHAVLKLQKGQDPRSIKGSISFPYAVRQKDIKVAVCVPVDLKDKAKEAGADFYDFSEITKQVQDGNIQFDVLLALPQMMPELAKYGKILGPRGLMPNPKTGSVVNLNNLHTVIQEFKKGKTVIKVDKTGVLHVAVGKINMSNEYITQNIQALVNYMQTLMGKSKESIFKSIFLAPTMGPSVKVNIKSI